MKIISKRAVATSVCRDNVVVDRSSLQQWQYIQAYLKASNAKSCAQEDLDRAMSVLPEELVLLSYTDIIRTTFKVKIIPAWAQVVATPDNFAGIVQNLSDGLSRYESCFARLTISIGDITSAFQALVCAQLDANSWRDSIRGWISQALSAENHDPLVEMTQKVKHIGLSDLFQRELVAILGSNITDTMNETYARSWEESHLNSIANDSIKRPQKLLSSLQIEVTDSQWMTLAQTGLANMRISELFDIIVDYPASVPALEDLKHCLNTTAARARLVAEFEGQCDARLLHPGANTPDIITIYISTIKALLLLDPPGVLLDKVARPIRRYLRERSDTIRCIITSLLGEPDSPLSIELLSDSPQIELNDEDDPNWEPDPIDAAPDYAKNRASDIIGSLTSIYENKEIFVRELQTFLSDRLLAITDYNIDQELRNLELLKVRFGEGMLAVCDVMLKDLSDSRRIDREVHNATVSHETDRLNNCVHTTVVSRLYWPTLKASTFTPRLPDAEIDPNETGEIHADHKSSTTDESDEDGLRLPQQVKDMMTAYASSFSAQKPQRSLTFLSSLGHVRVALTLLDRDFDMLVSPSHAACIALFDESSAPKQYHFDSSDPPDETGRDDIGDAVVKLPLSYISKTLNISATETKRALSFWVRQGILSHTSSLISSSRSSSDTTTTDEVWYQVLDRLPTTATTTTTHQSDLSTTHHLALDLDHTEPVTDPADSESQEDLDLSVYGSYVTGMLTNIGALEISRIQSMLGIFVPGYEFSEAQLSVYLARKVRDGELEVSGGLYRLAKR